MAPRELRVFQPEQEFGAESGSGHRGSGNRPAQRGGEGVSEAATESEVDEESDEIGQGFEEQMRMDGVAAQV